MRWNDRHIVAFSWRDHDDYRVWLVMVVVGSLGAITLAVFGTPPIQMHSPLHYLGVMDPLCGMTRAVRSMALGRLGTAWAYNPGSFVLAGAGGLVAARAAVGSLTGRWPTISISDPRPVRAVLAVSVAVLWINQQVHASLLMT